MGDVYATGHKFVVDKKYELEKSIGHGAYGQVIAAYDKVLKKKVAIKKITDAFDGTVYLLNLALTLSHPCPPTLSFLWLSLW